MTRYSREFLAYGTPLTPELARLHDVDTARVALPRSDELATARLENAYALKLVRKQERSERAAKVFLVLCAVVAGLVVGGLAAAVMS